MSPITIQAALRNAGERLDALDARVLLCHAIGRDTAYVLSVLTGERFTYQHVGRLLAGAADPPNGHDA